MPKPLYIGRFAPSPSGPLHLGSLFAAIISYCDAKHHQGEWRLRIDNLDPPRVLNNAIDQQLSQLDAFGLVWDGTIHYQADQRDDYYHALMQLEKQQACYACHCSRQLIRDRQNGQVSYDNHCRNLQHPLNLNQAWRLAMPLSKSQWQDAWCGPQRMSRPIEDPIIWRRDQIFGYHLACALDEITMGITHVVRGQDLLSATWPQRHIRQCLAPNLPALNFKHHPLLKDASGAKLSKSLNSPAVWPNQGATFKIANRLGLGDQVSLTMPDKDIIEVILRNWTWLTRESFNPHHLTLTL